jgi:cytochrome c peroxidase
MSVGLLSAIACYENSPPSEPPPPETTLDAQLRAAVQQWGIVLPIAEVPPQNTALVELGRALFFDKELSGNRDVSCSTCHDPITHAADGLSLAIGTGGTGRASDRRLGAARQFVPRNTPSMLNQALTFPYVFWDGRLIDRNLVSPADSALRPHFPLGGLNSTLAAQAMLPVLNRVEMRGERGDRDHLGNVNELAEIDASAPNDIWAAVMRRLLRINGYQTCLRRHILTSRPTRSPSITRQMR